MAHTLRSWLAGCDRRPRARRQDRDPQASAGCAGRPRGSRGDARARRRSARGDRRVGRGSRGARDGAQLRRLGGHPGSGGRARDRDSQAHRRARGGRARADRHPRRAAPAHGPSRCSRPHATSRDGGSLTILATATRPFGGETTVIALDPALVGTGGPPLDLTASGTVRAELLVGEEGARAIAQARASALQAAG